MVCFQETKVTIKIIQYLYCWNRNYKRGIWAKIKWAEGLIERELGIWGMWACLLTLSLCLLYVSQVCCFWKPVQKRKSWQAGDCWTRSIPLLTFWSSLLPAFSCLCFCSLFRGENVEDAFLEAAKKIYQNIQDGSLDLNAAESGVQHKPSAPQGGRLTSEPQPQREGCGC